jgi:hypothetical protein
MKAIRVQFASAALLCLTGGMAAAEDLVVMVSGWEIHGKILRANDELVMVESEGLQMSFPRRQVARIERGVNQKQKAPDSEVVTRRSTPSKPREASPSAWRFAAGVAGGVNVGSVDLQSDVVDLVGGGSRQLSSSLDAPSLGFDPGLRISGRWLADAAHSGLVVGVEGNVGSSSGSDVSLASRALSLQGGWSTRRGDYRLTGLARLGWEQAVLNRNVTLAAGARRDQAEIDTDLTGLTYGLEFEMAWATGAWEPALSLGLQRAQLTGETEWTSAQGQFQGRDEVDLVFNTLYLSASIAYIW